MTVTVLLLALAVADAASAAAVAVHSLGCPQVVHIDWEVYNGSCYWLSTYKDSWAQSRKACHTMSSWADLAAIHDLMENAWVKELSTKKDVWIGLNDIDEEGEFMWATGEVVDFLYWEPHQPDNEFFKQDCVHIVAELQTGQWDDEDCTMEKHFICKTALQLL